MKNKEKFKEQIMDYTMANESWTVTKTGDLALCDEMGCEGCIFDTRGESACSRERLKWLNSEYETNWQQVPTDAKVIGRRSPNEPWEQMYFACTKNAKPCVWENGKNSWTTDKYVVFEGELKLAEQIDFDDLF